MELYYFLAVIFCVISGFTHFKITKLNSRGRLQSSADNILYLMFSALSHIGLFVLFGIGLYVFSWWLPFICLISSLILVGFFYTFLYPRPAYVLISFPLSVIFTIMAI